jgi:hypothetical protein
MKIPLLSGRQVLATLTRLIGLNVPVILTCVKYIPDLQIIAFNFGRSFDRVSFLFG